MTATTMNKDIVKIIEACGKNGVSQIKMGDIEITFNGLVIQTEKDYPVKVGQVGNNVQVDPNLKMQEQYEMANEEDEHLLITDPAAYEESLFQNKMEDSDSHTDDMND